ncbi:MAG: phosphoglucosamine mutase [Bacteroidales bacterium]|nr:phosphoglucosamine mutase [Bacteroidales bacterium]
MSLIKSISGIRGTIGGPAGEGLTPLDVVKFTSAFATFLKKGSTHRLRVAVGRDARLSGAMVDRLVVGTLQGMGVDVVETGLSTTPTMEMTVIDGHCDGGIIITASHNPKHWNALKLLGASGEFISDAEGKEVLRLAESSEVEYADVDSLGTVTTEADWIDSHIARVLALPLVDRAAVAQAGFKVAVDAVNSTGGLAIPRLLKALGVEQVVELNCEPTGRFAHNPEPIPQNLTDIARVVRENHCDLGVVVDPDVDRLALVCENGEMFGEEYTLVSVADYILGHTPGNTVSNLSSSRALRDVTRRYEGCSYAASAVGEVNVTTLMKATRAVIGGEGNGGVIYPELHYGRDALVGVALFLTLLAHRRREMPGLTVSQLRQSYPAYVISKNRKDLTPDMDVDALLASVASHYKALPSCEVNTTDGVKIDFPDGWVHLRKSNTEPIIRIYSEAANTERANELAQQVIQRIG